MIHLKKIALFVLLIFTFVHCTEIYNPNISTGTEALIVEGLITDGNGPFTVKLTKAVPISFDSVMSSKTVLDANLTITDNENNTYTLTNAGSGEYTTPTGFKAQIGNSYVLHIQTSDGSVYVSKPQKLQPPQTYDSIRGYNTTQGYLNSANELVNVAGADIRVDLYTSVGNVDSVPPCRFKSNITLQYNYVAYEQDTISWNWFYFGWKSFDLSQPENITEGKTSLTNMAITNHSLGFIPFESSSYVLVPPYASKYYYLRINQYTMNNDSYRFYKAAVNQLSASGKIFDPVTAQLYGNMSCVNHPSKIVLGLFEVSSQTQSAILAINESSIKKVKVQLVPYVKDIPSAKEYYYKQWDSDPTKFPVKDSLQYVVIPFPSWWYHY